MSSLTARAKMICEDVPTTDVILTKLTSTPVPGTHKSTELLTASQSRHVAYHANHIKQSMVLNGSVPCTGLTIAETLPQGIS